MKFFHSSALALTLQLCIVVLLLLCLYHIFRIPSRQGRVENEWAEQNARFRSTSLFEAQMQVARARAFSEHDHVHISLYESPFTQRRLLLALESKWQVIRELADHWIDVTPGRPVLALLGLFHYGLHLETDRGGPTTDFVQWADLLSTLALMQLNVTIITRRQIQEKLSLSDLLSFDLIFLDYTAVNELFLHLRISDAALNLTETWEMVVCRMRIVDWYGTQNAWRKEWMKSPRAHTLQSWTGFPMESENTFLGLAILTKEINANISLKVQDTAVVPSIFVWGKEPRYFAPSLDISTHLLHIDEYLCMLWFAISEVSIANSSLKRCKSSSGLAGSIFMTSMSTNKLKSIPRISALPFLHSIGLREQTKFNAMLRSSLAFVGVGAPIDGISWLETLAMGVPFINPHFQNPYLHPGKPTSRVYTSQVPFAETFPEPWVYNIHNTYNSSEVYSVVDRLRGRRILSFIPPDFRLSSYLERVVRLVVGQHFCPSSTRNLHKRWADRNSGYSGACFCPYCLDCSFKSACSC